MRFNLALVAATLLSNAGAGTIGGPRNDVRIDVAAQEDGYDLFKRRGGGGAVRAEEPEAAAAPAAPAKTAAPPALDHESRRHLATQRPH